MTPAALSSGIVFFRFHSFLGGFSGQRRAVWVSEQYMQQTTEQTTGMHLLRNRT